MFATEVDLLDRRLQAARVARALFAPSEAIGGFVTTQLLVEHPLLGRQRPHVAVVQGDLPIDGLLRGVPVLVVQFGGGEIAGWLAAGVAAVWVLLDRAADLHVCGQPPQRLLPPAALTVPGHPGLRLPVTARGSWGTVR